MTDCRLSLLIYVVRATIWITSVAEELFAEYQKPLCHINVGFKHLFIENHFK